METKSRYEVIADLEQKKRDLIRERDGYQDQIERKEREIKNTKRKLEDLQEDLKNFKDNVKEKKETTKELIKGIESSLERFSKLQSKN